MPFNSNRLSRNVVSVFAIVTFHDSAFFFRKFLKR